MACLCVQGPQGPCDRRLPGGGRAPGHRPAYRGQVRAVRRGLCRPPPVWAGPCHRRLRPPRLLPGGAGGRPAGGPAAAYRRVHHRPAGLLRGGGGQHPLRPAGGLYAVHASAGAPAGAGGGQAHLPVHRSHAPAAPKSLRRRVGVPSTVLCRRGGDLPLFRASHRAVDGQAPRQAQELLGQNRLSGRPVCPVQSGGEPGGHCLHHAPDRLALPVGLPGGAAGQSALPVGGVPGLPGRAGGGGAGAVPPRPCWPSRRRSPRSMSSGWRTPWRRCPSPRFPPSRCT